MDLLHVTKVLTFHLHWNQYSFLRLLATFFFVISCPFNMLKSLPLAPLAQLLFCGKPCRKVGLHLSPWGYFGRHP